MYDDKCYGAWWRAICGMKVPKLSADKGKTLVILALSKIYYIFHDYQ